MVTRPDLHTHTLHSDGALSPAELMSRARDADVDLLAITDHDTVGAFEALGGVVPPSGLRVVPGVEFSTTWSRIGIHVVGLGIEPAHDAMQTAVQHQRGVRRARAVRIAGALSRAGLPDLWSEACTRAGHDSPGRPHFAAAIVAAGACWDRKHAFRRYLGKGRCGNVATDWADLANVIRWIRGAGGIAVLAHPARYKIGRRALGALVAAFAGAGGQALEVVSGRQDSTVTQTLAALSVEHGLLASGGSDFHSPEQSWLRLGLREGLPRRCAPVWEHL